MIQELHIERTFPIILCLSIYKLGNDAIVIVAGGKEHIGAVAMSKPSHLSPHSKSRKVDTSVLSIEGHKENILFTGISEFMSNALNGCVVVVGGIHVDNASPDMINDIVNSVKSMAEEACFRMTVMS